MSMTAVPSLSRDTQIALSLTWRYVIALCLIATLSTAAWFSLHLVISEQKSTAAVVNISGRQRMLSQRTALFANLLARTPLAERSKVRKQLQDAIGLMELSHRGLTHGSNELGLPQGMSPTVHALYFDQPMALDRQVEGYIRSIHQLLGLPDAALNPNLPLLQEITQTASTTLVAALDAMVRQYQKEGESAVRQLQLAETAFWLTTLLLLALEALLIFHPFVLHVRGIIGKLQGVSQELLQHKNQLEQTVQERTAELQNRSLALAESEEKFRLLSTAAKDGFVIVNAEGRVIYWNPAAEAIFGYRADEMLGQDLHSKLAPERYRDRARGGFASFQQNGVGKLIGNTRELLALRKDGSEFPVELSISAFQFKHSWHALGVVRDITERRRMEEEVRQLAFYDVLTKLPNRRLFNDRLGQAITACARSAHFSALMFLDLDNFKPLNDSHGHKVGDLLLIEVAERLKECVRETDTVSRFGGDEFVIMVNTLHSNRMEAFFQARIVAEKIQASLALPYVLEVSNEAGQDEYGSQRISHRCTASIGITLFDGGETSQEQLIKHADAAMYLAKQSGRNTLMFHAAENHGLRPQTQHGLARNAEQDKQGAASPE